jgi:hypothetical protein
MNADRPRDDLLAAILTLEEHGNAAGQHVAGVLRGWISRQAGDGASLETCLGFQPYWRFSWERRNRVAALIELRGRRFGHLKGRQAAAALEVVLLRYQASAWRLDRQNGIRPDGEHGALFDILSMGPVPGPETLRRLFG